MIFDFWLTIPDYGQTGLITDSFFWKISKKKCIDSFSKINGKPYFCIALIKKITR